MSYSGVLVRRRWSIRAMMQTTPMTGTRKRPNGNGESPPARGQIPNDVQDDDVGKDDDRGKHDDGQQAPFPLTPLLRHHPVLP